MGYKYGLCGPKGPHKPLPSPIRPGMKHLPAARRIDLKFVREIDRVVYRPAAVSTALVLALQVDFGAQRISAVVQRVEPYRVVESEVIRTGRFMQGLLTVGPFFSFVIPHVAQHGAHPEVAEPASQRRYDQPRLAPYRVVR